MLFYMIVTLYTSRVILMVLGTDDYGTYNIVGGIVMMFNFLNQAMVSSSQRFISYEQGKGDETSQTKVFSTSVVIHLIIALVILLLSETIGIWWLNNKLVVAPDRLYAAKWVFQSSILAFICTITTVPYVSSVIAHEKMGFYAIVTIMDATMKLIIAFIIPYFSYDKLILYAILTTCISFLNFIVYRIYCKRLFSECHFFLHKDYHYYNKMLSFAGWSFVGNFGVSAKDYGVNIVVNLFSGPAVNAARGIAYQVTMAINGFVSNFQTAMRPQITKRFAAGEIDSMMTLVKNGSRYSFYLLSFIAVPLLIRANYVLHLWLSAVPEYTLAFLQLALLMGVINSMYGPFMTAIQATGNIKIFQICIALIMCLDLPIAYYILSKGAPPYSVMYVAIATSILALFARLYLLYREVKFNLVEFVITVVFKNACLFIAFLVLPFYASRYIAQNFIGLCVIIVISTLWTGSFIYFVGLSKAERLKIINNIKSKLCK